MERIKNETLTKLFVEFNDSLDKLISLVKGAKKDFLKNYACQKFENYIKADLKKHSMH